MTTAQRATQTIKAVTHMQDVPPERWTAIVKRCLLGLLFGWLGLQGMAAEWNQYLVVALFFFGGNLISNQMLTGFAKRLAEPLAAIVKATKGGE